VGAPLFFEPWRIRLVERILHGIEVIEVAEELIEAVQRGQVRVEVTKVVLTKLPRGVTHILQHGGNRGSFIRHPDLRARLSDRGNAGADRQFTGDKVGPAGRATGLGIVVGEYHTLGGQLVDVGRTPGHQAPVVRADVPHTDVVTHDDDDVGFLILRRGRSNKRGEAQGNARADQIGEPRHYSTSNRDRAEGDQRLWGYSQRDLSAQQLCESTR